MSEVFNYCHVVGKTDVGRKRAANEDSMGNAITQNGLVAVVCDGMGGHVGGATASRIAVGTILNHLNSVYYEDPRIAIGESIDIANQAILKEASEHPELNGMGSTCVLLLVRDGKVYIGHVGDSRIYLVRSKRIVQLTKDHSYVQMLVDCGEITKEQAEHHPRKNEITNALGIPNMSPATVADQPIIPEAGDCFVLCSDGLSGMVPDSAINKVVSKQTEMNAQERVDYLVALANNNGGIDNITAQLVEFPVSPAAAAESPKSIPLWLIIGASALCLLLLVGGFFIWKHNKASDEPDRVVQISDEKADDAPSVFGPLRILDLPFKKNERILEMSFEKDGLVFKRKNDVVYRLDSAFDPTSLKVSSDQIKVGLENSSLSFTDAYPGSEVSFTLKVADKNEVYSFIIGINEEKNKVGGGDVNTTTGKMKDNPVEQAAKDEEKPEVQTVDVSYGNLEGARVLFNYSAKPSLRVIGKEITYDYKVDAILENALVYDDLNWEKEHKHGKPLLFKFKGDSSKQVHHFEIPFVTKGDKKTVILSIQLTPAQQEVQEVVKEEPSSEEQSAEVPAPSDSLTSE